jgi:hypothetical protein
VHELYCPTGGGTWHLNDLTVIVAAPPAAAGSPLTSWADPANEHVIFLDAGGHVHEMYCPTGGGTWGHNDLTAMVSAPPAAAGSPLTSWTDPANEHVIFLDGSGHVHEMHCPVGGAAWGHNDLTTIAAAPPAFIGRALTSWADAHYEHVSFLDGSGHVRELHYLVR